MNLNLRIIDIRDGVATYKVNGVSRRVDIPKGTRDITAHLLKLEGYGVPEDKPKSSHKHKPNPSDD